MVSGRVVEDLADLPVAGQLLDDQQSRAARVRAGAELVVLGEVRLQCLLPGLRVPAVLLVQRAQLVATILNMRDGVIDGVADMDLTRLEAALAAATAACIELRAAERQDRMVSQAKSALSWQITACLKEFET